MSLDARAESELLHQRVRRFAQASLRALDSHERVDSPDSFERLAFDIAAHQARHNPVVSRLAARAGPRSALLDLPAVAADVFRLARVAAHPADADVARFQTSGTTGGAGVHAFRTLETYRELSVEWGRRALLPTAERAGALVSTVLALAPAFEPERRSSLGFMLQAFIESFDLFPRGSGADPRPAGVLVSSGASGAPPPPPAAAARGAPPPLAVAPVGVFAADPRPADARPGGVTVDHWLLGPGGLDLAAFERGVTVARERGESVLLLATSFALVWLLEALAERKVPLPAGSVVMHTGGFKGKSRHVPAAELVRDVCRALSLEPSQLIGEYGMTELSSQLYDRGFVLDAKGGGGSVFVAPPWLEVIVVDPVTFATVPDGEVGLARFVDLANIDSALVIQTQDRVRRVAGGIQLQGRQPGAVLRGCSLGTEGLAEQIASG